MKLIKKNGDHTFLECTVIIIITLALAFSLDAAASLYRTGSFHEVSGVYGGYYDWSKKTPEEETARETDGTVEEDFPNYVEKIDSTLCE